MEHVCDIAHLWLRLDKTYIGADQAAHVIEKLPGCDWVRVESHKLMPSDGRIQLKSLQSKLDANEIPQKSALLYKDESPTFAYYHTYAGHFTPPQSRGKPIALDLFAGGGGMSVGLKRAGWNVKYKVDMDSACCQTLRENFRKSHVFNSDINDFLEKLKAGKLKRKIDLNEITLLHGSPPCQGFCGASKCFIMFMELYYLDICCLAILNNSLCTFTCYTGRADTSGGKHDKQNKQCSLDFLKVVEYIQPPYVSMENVPGMAMERKLFSDKTNKAFLQEIVARLRAMGYQVLLTMVSASSFGDPQDRKRLVLIAAKQGLKLPSAPRETHGDDLKPFVTVKNALSDLENVEPTRSGKVVVAGKTVKGHKLEGTANPSNSKGATKIFENEPSHTLIKNNKYAHYSNRRFLTLLEYKRLMSFPDKHFLCGTQKEQRDQIGNAVPCCFAQAIGDTIMESYLNGACSSQPQRQTQI